MGDETTPASPATQPAGWLGKIGRACMDGLTLQACAERGCLPDDWLQRTQQSHDTRDTTSPTIGKR